MPIVNVKACQCRVCKHTWLCGDVSNPPKQCAKCRRRDWNDGYEVTSDDVTQRDILYRVTRDNVTASIERVKAASGKIEKWEETKVPRVEDSSEDGPTYDFNVGEEN